MDSTETLYKLLKKPLNLRRLRPFVEHCTRCRSAFLRGFFDSEGTVTTNGEIYVFNTDLRLLRYVKQLLASMKIATTGPHLHVRAGTPINDLKKNKTYFTKKDVYDLYIPANSRLNFHRHVGFTIQRKRKRLENYLIRRGLLRQASSQTLPQFFPLYSDSLQKSLECIKHKQTHGRNKNTT